jgi:murein L,D-transpeptidase YafK
MKFIKFACIVALVASALLPWNATAIDRLQINHFFGQTLSSVVSHSKSSSNTIFSNNPEDLLVQSLYEVGQGQLQQASDTIDHLLQIAPNFKLAQLVRGDLLMAQAQQFQTFGSASIADSRVLQDLKDEARTRIERHLTAKPPEFLPALLWQMDSSQTHAIVVDAAQSRLYVYRNENGIPTYVADYYVTIGKNGSEKQTEGDKRTPLGVYFLGTRLNRKLDDLYGDAAYPISYPNEWDRRQGKNGSGIWLHGTPHDTYSRAPRASDGCVVLSNPDLKALEPILQGGNVPLVIMNSQITSNADQASQHAELAQTMEQWRKDWQEQDTDAYLAHYSPQFTSESMAYERWSSEKRRIQASKPEVSVKISNVSMFSYPVGAKPMAVVNFDQSFKSAVINNRMRKRQYWIYDNNRWQILYEGPI